jgi:hypothetical protein
MQKFRVLQLMAGGAAEGQRAFSVRPALHVHGVRMMVIALQRAIVGDVAI